ncbi:endonuclease/exonuclease/phosphatase family protein-like protein [Plenodomus tracheiphilus IPT5]|uniref:Endonuclease/exonuclease/phosphatase family protein-like protein n=1 Tax=Plenodomus tracheiphilus IPT5 TaxID=1408161 RepID=A0A6A7BER1_9PLEO|nr:endonuclease/exonuclease/phosphatase family protein-like protein [Plenodomus tracheiphilus IPT5]
MHLSPLHPLILLATLLTFAMRVHANLPIRIITHNIRQAVLIPTIGEKLWSDRKQLILNELHYNTLHNPEAFICLQEVLHEQLVDILAGLGDEWTHIGVGRDDGKEKGEYSPVLYRKAVWELVNWRTVWLNEDGAVGKKGWDAGSVRILTIGTFRHYQSKKEIVGMSTHLDNSGTIARRESAKIILKSIDAATNPTPNSKRLPFFLGSDANSQPSGEAYQILNNASTALTQDAKELAKWKYGDEHTFTDFSDDEKGFTLIDFIWVGPRGGGDWEVEGYSVLPNKFEDGVFGSDHRAVVVDGVLSV